MRRSLRGHYRVALDGGGWTAIGAHRHLTDQRAAVQLVVVCQRADILRRGLRCRAQAQNATEPASRLKRTLNSLATACSHSSNRSTRDSRVRRPLMRLRETLATLHAR